MQHKRLKTLKTYQDDIDEMRAEEQAQQAEAQITMFELLRLSKDCEDEKKTILIIIIVREEATNFYKGWGLTLGGKKSVKYYLKRSLLTYNNSRSPTLRMPLTIAIMMQLSQQVRNLRSLSDLIPSLPRITLKSQRAHSLPRITLKHHN